MKTFSSKIVSKHPEFYSDFRNEEIIQKNCTEEVEDPKTFFLETRVECPLEKRFYMLTFFPLLIF